MSYILAIEPDPRQAHALSRVAKDRVGADLTIVDSNAAAIASINRRLPDLILVTVLLSPREEEELIAHLRTLEGAEHLQTLTIPLLAAPPRPEDRPKRGMFGKKKPADMIEAQGCDPVLFAEQISSYLKTSTELKAAAEAARLYAERNPPPQPQPAPETPVDPAAYTPLFMVESPGEPVAKQEPVDSPVPPVVELAPPAPMHVEPPQSVEPPRAPAVRGGLFERPKRIIADAPRTTPIEPRAPAAAASSEPAPIAYAEPSPVTPPEPVPTAPILASAPAEAAPPPAPVTPVRVKQPPAPIRLVQRLPPLAMWARFQSAATDAAPAKTEPAAADDPGDPVGLLRVPGAIATVSYPKGCRIRRVTATPAAGA